MPPGILYDTTAAPKSIQRIRAYTDQIIARHDPSIEDSQDYKELREEAQKMHEPLVKPHSTLDPIYSKDGT